MANYLCITEHCRYSSMSASVNAHRCEELDPAILTSLLARYTQSNHSLGTDSY